MKGTSIAAQSGGKSMALTGGGDQSGDSMMRAALISKLFGEKEKPSVATTGPEGGPTIRNAQAMELANAHANTVIKDAVQPIQLGQDGQLRYAAMGRNPFDEFMRSASVFDQR